MTDDAADQIESTSDILVDADDGVPAAPVDDQTKKTRPVPRRDKGLFIASFVIACGLALIAWGMLTAITGTDGIDRPDAIEDVSPVENALQVLQQDRVVVDLQFGYEAELTIDGITLETTTVGQVNVAPGQQLEFPATAIFDRGNAIISFQPSDDAAITEFTQGRHEARVEFWLTEDPDNRRSYNWSFIVV